MGSIFEKMMKVISILNFYDGITEFIGMVLRTNEKGEHLHPTFYYGALASQPHDGNWVYSCWRLPPKANKPDPKYGGKFAVPDMTIMESELEVDERA